MADGSDPVAAKVVAVPAAVICVTVFAWEFAV